MHDAIHKWTDLCIINKFCQDIIKFHNLWLICGSLSITKCTGVSNISRNSRLAAYFATLYLKFNRKRQSWNFKAECWSFICTSVLIGSLFWKEFWLFMWCNFPFFAAFQFKYGTKTDIFLSFLGLICAVCHGLALPLLIVVFGDMTDLFIGNADLSQIYQEAVANTTYTPVDLSNNPDLFK